MTLYVLETDAARGGFLKEFMALKPSKESPIRVTVEIGPEKKKRSLDQNSLFHVWCQTIATETGNEIEDVKNALKDMHLPKKVSKIGTKARLVTPSTSALSVEEFSLFMDKVLAWTQMELNITLPTTEQVLYG